MVLSEWWRKASLRKGICVSLKVRGRGTVTARILSWERTWCVPGSEEASEA